MAKDTYKEFAERYDLFLSGGEQRDRAAEEFFRCLIVKNNVYSVLDCACGTGHDLIMLKSLGCEVCGTDISEAMLARARNNIEKAGIEVSLEKVDYRELPKHFKSKKFDMVVCLSTSIGEMSDDAESLKAFCSMYGVLRQGGILVLTQGTTDRQMREKPRFIPVIMTDEFTRVFVIDYLDKGERVNILDIFHNKDRRDFKQWSIDYLNILLRDEQERLLKAAGFKGVDFYGAYDFTPYDKETSQRLITVGRK